MASTRSKITSTQTQTVVREKTLILRRRAIQLVEGVRFRIATELPALNDKLKQAKKSEREKIVDDMMSVFKAGVNDSLDLLSKEVKSHAPTRPSRKHGQSEEEFQKMEEEYNLALAAYEAYKELAMRVIKEVMEEYLKALKKVEDFCDPLLEMIKANDKDMDKKIKEFLDQVSREMNEGMQGVFDAVLAEVKSWQPASHSAQPHTNVLAVVKTSISATSAKQAQRPTDVPSEASTPHSAPSQDQDDSATAPSASNVQKTK